MFSPGSEEELLADLLLLLVLVCGSWLFAGLINPQISLSQKAAHGLNFGSQNLASIAQW